MKANIIYPIMIKEGVYWDRFLDRLECSLKSLKSEEHLLDVCIFDASKNSNFEKIIKIVPDFYFYYHHEYIEEEFQKAKVLNKAIKVFPEKEVYFTSDHDIIYPEQYFNININKLAQYDLIVPNIYRCNTEQFVSNTKLLTNVQPRATAPGNVVYKKLVYDVLNGYNEYYYTTGFDDSDFNIRAKKHPRFRVFYGANPPVYTLWHPKWYDHFKYTINGNIYHNYLENYYKKNINFIENWKSLPIPDYKNLIEKFNKGELK